MDKGGAKEYH